MNYQLSTILMAYILDLIIGDPQFSWHPVRILGRWIERLEKVLNRGKSNKRFAGVILVIIVLAVTIFSVWAVLAAARLIHPVLYYVSSVLFIYFALSVKALGLEVNKVYQALRDKDIQQARDNLSMIVGRDTEKLDEPDIIRASVETIAESTMDGIIAPLFYAFLGGPVLMWAYKAINTLDSMVGHKNERFREFGKAGALIDGWVNLIPAKITSCLISASSIFCRKNWLHSLKWGIRYLLKGPKDNSEATEASMAGALGVRLGGVNFYGSIAYKKSYIGEDINPLGIGQIKEGIVITYISSAFFLGMGSILLIGRR